MLIFGWEKPVLVKHLHVMFLGIANVLHTALQGVSAVAYAYICKSMGPSYAHFVPIYISVDTCWPASEYYTQIYPQYFLCRQLPHGRLCLLYFEINKKKRNHSPRYNNYFDVKAIY